MRIGNGFWKLSWLEFKIFVREPMGLFGTVGVPVLLFLLLGKLFGRRADANEGLRAFLGSMLPVLATILIAFSAVLSLVAIISIYREGGILKRLRATPLTPLTILGAHVFVKLALTAATLGLLLAAGKRFYPVPLEVDPWRYALALLIATTSILSIGFVIASLVPTARFAQPIGSAILYPMLAISGLFFPIDRLPGVWESIAGVLPVTRAVSLLEGVWQGDPLSAHPGDLALLAANLVVCSLVASRVFRWE